MYQFLVLGIIPGTQFEITFAMWSVSFVGTCLGLALWYIEKSPARRMRVAIFLEIVLMKLKDRLLLSHPANFLS